MVLKRVPAKFSTSICRARLRHLLLTNRRGSLIEDVLIKEDAIVIEGEDKNDKSESEGEVKIENGSMLSWASVSDFPPLGTTAEGATANFDD